MGAASLHVVERVFNSGRAARCASMLESRRRRPDRAPPGEGSNAHRAARTAAIHRSRRARPAAAAGSAGVRSRAGVRAGHARAGLGRGNRARHHRVALPVAVGGVSAGFTHRGVAAGLPASHPGRARRAGRVRAGLCLLPGARRIFPARASLHHRPLGRGPGHYVARHRRRAGHPRSRAPQVRHRRADPGAAERIVTPARPTYYINAGLHSDETGSTESVLELASRLAVSEQPMIRRIRERVVVLINPVSNPDGRDKQVEWFYRYLKGKTDLDSLPRQAPPYWSKYAYVDINRDAHQQVHETTKAVFRMFFGWHPQVIHDLHESVALLVTWNGTGPINQHVDPLSYAEQLELSFHEVQTLTGLGMPGVWTWNFGDDFAHLYLDSIATNHNADGRGYETFGNGSAETMVPKQPGQDDTVEWYRPSPPPPQGSFLWSARDNVNYNETGLLAALDDTAQQWKTLLRNYYRKGLHSYRRGIDTTPFGFIIPAGQGDPTRVAQMVARLLAQGIEGQRATADITLKEGQFPAGTYVVRLDQPYRDYAVDLLTAQDYPKDAGEAYDDISWELPANYHLSAIPTADARVRELPLAALDEAPHPQGQLSGDGPVFVLRDTGQEELLEARYRLSRFKVAIAERRFTLDGAQYPAGSWILAPAAGLAAAVRETA